MFQLTTRYLSLTNAVSSFSFLKQPCLKTYPVFMEHMLLFQKGPIIGLHQVKKTKKKQAKKTTKEIAETTNSGFLKCIIKTWKDSGEPSSSKVWGCCSWSVLGSAMLCAKNMRSADYLNDHVVLGFFLTLLAWAYSKMKMPGFIRLKTWKSGSGSMRHQFHTWMRTMSPDLNPNENLPDVLQET